MDRPGTAGSTLSELLTQAALSGGFDLAGVVDVDHANLEPHIQAYDHWLNQGYSGKMEYLKRGRDRRGDVRLVFPKTQSVLAVAIRYKTAAAGNPDGSGPRYARYLQGPDYHLTLKAKLESALNAANLKWKELGNSGFEFKVCVDTSAVLERAWAAECGLGWIGKNTLLIHPKLGSYLFLAVGLISQSTGENRKPLPEYCGHCQACITGCPTQAIEAPRLLNATTCLSYLTLEHRGPFTPAQIQKMDQAAQAKSPWIAGCDLCQEVCPFNKKPARIQDQTPSDVDPTTLTHWRDLLLETPAQYLARSKDTALDRISYLQASRNLASLAQLFWPGLKAETQAHLELLRHVPDSQWVQDFWKQKINQIQNEGL